MKIGIVESRFGTVDKRVPRIQGIEIYNLFVMCLALYAGSPHIHVSVIDYVECFFLPSEYDKSG